MRFLILPIAFLIFPACNRQTEQVKTSAQPILIEVSPITPDEHAVFARIGKAYPDFHYSKSVKRYYELVGGKRIPIKCEMVFSHSGDLLFGEFVGYSVRFDPDLEAVQYNFDAGTGYRGHGAIIISGAGLTRTEYSCGVTSCGLEVKSNGKIVHEARIEND